MSNRSGILCLWARMFVHICLEIGRNKLAKYILFLVLGSEKGDVKEGVRHVMVIYN